MNQYVNKNLIGIKLCCHPCSGCINVMIFPFSYDNRGNIRTLNQNVEPLSQFAGHVMPLHGYWGFPSTLFQSTRVKG